MPGGEGFPPFLFPGTNGGLIRLSFPYWLDLFRKGITLPLSAAVLY